jgi:recombinational DNA repair ATPase RecF
MDLSSFRVENFRNILDSETGGVDGRITCLVGKTESGKTDILHTLHALNPALSDRLSGQQQYPR